MDWKINYYQYMRPKGDPGGDIAGALQDFRDYYSDQKQKDIANKRAEASASEYKRQNDINERRLGDQEKREKAKFGVDMSDRNRKIFDELHKRYSEGGESEAEAYAKTAEYFDPETGEKKSIGFDRGGQMPAYKGPLQLDQPELGRQPGEKLGGLLAGKLRLDSSADQPASAATNPLEPPPFTPAGQQEEQTEPKPDGDELPDIGPAQRGAARFFNLKASPEVAAGPPSVSKDDMLDSVDQYNRDAAAVKKPAVVLPNGERVDLDPGERDRYRAKKADEQKQRLMSLMSDPTLPPDLKRSIAMQAGLTGAQATGGERAQISNAENREDAQAHTDATSGKYKLTADQQMEIARLRAKKHGKGNGTGQPSLGDEKKRLDIEQEYMEAAEKTLSKLGYADVVKDERKLNDLATNVAGAKENAALASIVSGAFVKYAQGGTGVISDQDMKVFWNRIGGLGIRTKQAFEDAMSGRMTPEKQKAVQEAVNGLLGASKSHENEIGQRLESNVSALPGGNDRLPRVLQTYAPNYYKSWNAKRAASGSKDALQHYQDEADQWAKELR